MKKIIAVLLSVLLMLAVTACGETGASGEASTDGGTVNTRTEADASGRDAYDSAISGHDVTLVTVLATWSTPSTDMLPALQEISAKYSVVGIFQDSVDPATYARDDDIVETGIAIMNDAGATFTIVVPDEALFTAFCADATYTPTSYLVDRDGNIIGEPLVGGADAAALEAYIASAPTA